MDIFSETSPDIFSNGFPFNRTVFKVAAEEAPRIGIVFTGHFLEDGSLGRGGLSKALSLRQQAAVLRGTQPNRHTPQFEQRHGSVDEREQPD